MLTPATLFPLSTVRIVARASTQTKLGTGYFYQFAHDRALHYPVIITNKHVVENAVELNIVLQLMPIGSAIEIDGSAGGEHSESFSVKNLRTVITNHPNPDVDLCCIFISDIMNAVTLKGMQLKHSFLNKDSQLNATQTASLRPVEPVVMVGYPNGLWDAVNNRPIVRQGITASHALLRWNAKPEFLIDCAAFGGSSGSPVFLYEDGLVHVGQNHYVQGTRAVLLGTLWGGPVLSAEGKLEPRAIPTADTIVPVMQFMINLGFVIHAAENDELGKAVLLKVAQLESLANNRAGYKVTYRLNTNADASSK